MSVNPKRLSIRDLVPAPDLISDSLINPERSHSAAQSALLRKYKSFKAEVSLKKQIEVECENYEIHGRIDGIRRVRGGFCIYEIKPVPDNPKRWKRHAQLLQARLQLILYCDLFQSGESDYRGKLKKAILLLIGEDGRVCEDEIEISQSEGALRKRIHAIRKNNEAMQSRFNALSNIENSFLSDRQTDRPLQAEAEAVIASRPLADRLLLTLPPGAGKTRIAMRFALRVSLTHSLQIVWITAKSAGRHTVLEEVNRLRALGIDASTCWKTSSNRLCTCDSPDENCNIRSLTRAALFFGEISDDELLNHAEVYCPHQINRYLENQVNIVVADINYLLNSSSLTQRAAILIIDEVQHFVDRVIESSRIRIPIRQLRNLVFKLPASRRDRYSELLNPEWLDDELLSCESSLWINLADEIRQRRIEDNLAESILRLSRLLSGDSESYQLTWYSTGTSSGWLGAMTEPEHFTGDIIEKYPVVAALSGSLPDDHQTLQTMLPGFADFLRISPAPCHYQTVVISPQLDFRFPISQTDILKSVANLLKLHEEFSSTIAVFTQNRESSLAISEALRVRSCVSILDQDIDAEWRIIEDLSPDFVFIPLGSNLSESVNPPDGVFSCAVVLSPGHQPQDNIFLQSSELSKPTSYYHQSVRESVSRIIQAVGRVQRSPESMTPVFLLNQAFVRPEFLELWPRSWHQNLSEIIFENISESLEHIRALQSQKHNNRVI